MPVGDAGGCRNHVLMFSFPSLFSSFVQTSQWHCRILQPCNQHFNERFNEQCEQQWWKQKIHHLLPLVPLFQKCPQWAHGFENVGGDGVSSVRHVFNVQTQTQKSRQIFQQSHRRRPLPRPDSHRLRLGVGLPPS
jgi:hypothetical protein